MSLFNIDNATWLPEHIGMVHPASFNVYSLLPFSIIEFFKNNPETDQLSISDLSVKII